jgi:nucleoid DNA-binding protein
MPHVPPIKRRELRKKGLLDETTFFRELSARCNYADEETVRRFYGALVKTITAQLRNNKVCRLPHLGDFALVEQKPRSVLSGKSRTKLQPVVLKFYPNDGWRQYFAFRGNIQ